MKNYGGHLKLEAFANISSSLLSDLNEEISKLRKSGDYSQDSLEKSQVGEIIKAHTGINIVFYVSDKIGHNAFAKFPTLDNSHPFFTQMGIEPWFRGETAISNLDRGPLEGTVDRKKYKVSGIFSQVEAPIVIGHALMKDKDFTNEEITEIIGHEVGHYYSYFELLGNVVRESWLISNASRVAAGAKDPELKKKVLIRTQEQLGVEPLNHDDLLQSATATRKDAVELVLVSNTLIKVGTQSNTRYYDARTVEQLADAFVAYHGGGRALASALVKFSKKTHGLSTRHPVTYIVVELMKTLLTMVMFFSLPVSTIIWLVAMVPSNKIYDDPEMRVNTLKQQMIQSLRQVNNEEEKQILLDEIKALEACAKELSDKRNFYTMIYEAITPIGRKRYNQEKQQEAIKSLLFNEFQAKALEMRN